MEIIEEIRENFRETYLKDNRSQLIVKYAPKLSLIFIQFLII